MSPAWKARSSPHARTGSGWSRNSARCTKSSKSARFMSACWAPACVGHNVEHQRLRIVCSRSGLRARAARASFAGSMPTSARVFSGAWMPIWACAFFASA